jgi:hypothetical protein
LYRNADTLATNPVPKTDVSIKPNDEEQLAHTVEKMLRDEPENNEVLVVPLFFILIIFVSLIPEELCRR